MEKDYFEGRSVDEAKVERKRLRDIVLVVIGGLFIAGALRAVMGCSQLPTCEGWQYRVVENQEGDQFLLIDGENTEKLNALLNGLMAGTCKIAPKAPPPGTQGT